MQSLVVGDGPCGGGHNSVLDLEVGVVGDTPGETCPDGEGQASRHLRCNFVHADINMLIMMTIYI